METIKFVVGSILFYGIASQVQQLNEYYSRLICYITYKFQPKKKCNRFFTSSNSNKNIVSTKIQMAKDNNT